MARRTLEQMKNEIALEVDNLAYWNEVLKRLRLEGQSESPAVVKVRDRAGLRARQSIIQAADELKRVFGGEGA